MKPKRTDAESTGLAINLPCPQPCGLLCGTGSLRSSQLPPEADLQPSAQVDVASILTFALLMHISSSCVLFLGTYSFLFQEETYLLNMP